MFYQPATTVQWRQVLSQDRCWNFLKIWPAIENRAETYRSSCDTLKQQSEHQWFA